MEKEYLIVIDVLCNTNKAYESYNKITKGDYKKLSDLIGNIKIGVTNNFVTDPFNIKDKSTSVLYSGFKSLKELMALMPTTDTTNSEYIVEIKSISIYKIKKIKTLCN